jgi:hypothetical protein
MRTLANATQQQLHATGIPSVEYIAGISATETHYAAIVEALSRQGHFGLIDDPKTLDVTPLKQKSATLHWEFMFTRSLYQTADIAPQPVVSH